MSKEITHPIEYILDKCEELGVISKFVLLNARDQLKRMGDDNYCQIGWARTNDRGDIYDLRLHEPIADNVIELFIKKGKNE